MKAVPHPRDLRPSLTGRPAESRDRAGGPRAAWPLGLALLLSALTAGRADVASLTVANDTFITSSAPDNNAGGHPWFDAGRDGVGGVRRGLLRFDLSGIPPGSAVTSAVVQLTVVQVPFQGSIDSTFDLFRLLAGWGEGTKIGNGGSLATSGEATWNARMQGTANWTAPGARSDAAATASASSPVGSVDNATYSWSSAGLVSDVQLWVDNPAQNFGWLLASQAEGSARSARGFASREGGVNVAALEVGYTPAPNQAPTVTIDSPTNNASFNAPASVPIDVTAMDADGSVANVQFFDGAASLGNDVLFPYSLTASLAPGNHALSAVATDNMGASSTSAVVNVIVRTVPIDNPIAERIPKGDITIELRPIADGMVSPLGMAVPDDGSGRMFVYDQVGVVWVVTASGRLPTPLLDLRTRLVNISGAYDERGLLGLAAHPNFAQNPLLYTYTSEPNSGPADFPSTLPVGTTNNHQSVVAEWRLNPATTNRVDPATRREIFRIDKPQSNHNGGTMRFGPDGLLYISLGDGGQADDQGNGHSPGGNGQDTTNILGSLIRIDVDGGNSANGKYGVPVDNPFVGVPGVDEIFAYGLRNPFSFNFDRGSGLLYLGDVGQNKVEEVDIIQKGGNYGWNIKEGTFYFDPNGAGAGYVTTVPVRPVPPDLVDPIAQYDHDDGTAVIGGSVYRGSQLPGLAGRYVFGDWGIFGSPSGRLYYLDANSAIKELRIGLDDRPLGLYLKGFGEDAAGELYVFASEPQGPTGIGGIMYKIVPPPAAALAVISGVATNGTNFQTAWRGGIGPFAQQRKLVLNEPFYLNESFLTGTSAIVPQRGASGFFREVDTTWQLSVPFTALLNGANERPAIATAGEGFAIFNLEGNSLTFTITYRGLGSLATLAHIHGPAAATNTAGVLIDLQSFRNGPFGTNGSFSGTIVLSDTQKAYLMSGRTYVNIHTVNNGGGEIRGQIAPVLMQASLLGAYQNPPVDEPGRGFGSFTLIGNQLTFNVTYQGLSGPASMAHIHGPAPIGQDAGVMIDFDPFKGSGYGSNGVVSGSVALNAAQLAAVIEGQTYCNFHTAAHGGGEIRGQIVPQSTAVPFTAAISGLNERPTALTNSATGFGIFSLEGDRLAFNITYSGLSGPATLAHIHGPAPTTGATGVQIDLQPFNGGAFGTNGTFSGAVTLTSAQRNMVLNGLAYVNIHTSANPGGEARGQIASVLMTAAASGPAERPNSIATAGSALGLFALVGTQLNLNVVYKDLSGPASDAHIHAPASASQTASVVVGFTPFNGGAWGAFGAVTGTTNLSATVANYLIDSLGYINFHTTANGSGEIRGQIAR
jgi:glucose/arabinose dehydrogenase